METEETDAEEVDMGEGADGEAPLKLPPLWLGSLLLLLLCWLWWLPIPRTRSGILLRRGCCCWWWWW